MDINSLAEREDLYRKGLKLCRNNASAQILGHCIYDIMRQDRSPSENAVQLVGYIMDRLPQINAIANLAAEGE